MTEIERQLDNSQQIETLYALYQQASSQRDVLMTQQVEAWKQLMLANEVIFKAVVNRTHWKRTATRYLKKHAPNFYAQTKSEWENDGVADD
jgi:ATP-dependent protease ClpP protease subunit